MKKFILKCNAKGGISFYTDSTLVINKIYTEQNCITKTIPATVEFCGEVDSVSEEENYLIFRNSNMASVNLNIEKNIGLLSLPENNLFFPDLVYLAAGMIANCLQKEKKYIVQSSVAKYDDDTAVMFIGDPNAGKTTLASKLILTKNWSLVSNDNVLVGVELEKFKTYAGTKNIQMRYGAIQLFFPELLSQIDQPAELGKRNEWDVKVYVDNLFSSLDVKYDDLCNISDIYLINTMKNGGLFLREREPIDKLLLIYEHLTKQIRSNRYLLTSFDLPMPSFEQDKYMNDRYLIAKEVANIVELHEVKGDCDEIVKALRKKHEK